MSSPTRDLDEFTQRSTLLGVGVFLLNVVTLSALIGGALLCRWWPLQAVLAVLAGINIGTLFVVGHDAAHNSLTPHRWLNNLLGHLSLLPAVHPYSLWVLVHNQTHHRWTNLSPLDYVWTPLDRETYESLPRAARWWYRFCRTPWGVFAYYFYEFWIKRMIFPSRKEVRGEYKREYLIDIGIALAFAAAYVAFLVIGAGRGWFGERSYPLANALVFGALIPFVIWNGLMSFVIYLHHTHPQLKWYNDEAQWRAHMKQRDSAVHVIFPGPVNLIFHWIMEHNAHHDRPSVPLYQLLSAQHRLEETYPGTIIVHRWTPLSYWDVARRCKLYDYKNHWWTDFEGRATSPPLNGCGESSAGPETAQSPSAPVSPTM